MFSKIIISFLIMSQTFAHANNTTNHKADDHAPIGVMGDHLHAKGEWMLSYRYNNMSMDGNDNDGNDLSQADILSDFMMTPLNMTMEMHMLGAMFGASDKLTLMLMSSYIYKTMNNINRMGLQTKVRTRGLGDARFSALYSLYKSDHQEVLGSIGISLPVGSIDHELNSTQILPYPMQLGSGTYDGLVSLTYKGNDHSLNWGAQFNGVFRFGRNSADYRLGSQYELTTWIMKSISDSVSFSARLDAKYWNNIKGSDSSLNSIIMMMPTARTDLRSGKRVDALAGVNYLIKKGILAGNRLSIEYGLPVYQNLRGPQLKVDHRFILGWQLAF